MIVNHRFVATSLCPEDGTRDYYYVTVEVDDMVPVERIRAFFDSMANRVLYQEELTEKAADELGIRVRTRSIHSGVRTICEA